MRIIALFCWGGVLGGGVLKSIKGLGHTHKYSTSFIHSFQPQAKLAYALTEGQ